MQVRSCEYEKIPPGTTMWISLHGRRHMPCRTTPRNLGASQVPISEVFKSLNWASYSNMLILLSIGSPLMLTWLVVPWHICFSMINCCCDTSRRPSCVQQPHMVNLQMMIRQLRVGPGSCLCFQHELFSWPSLLMHLVWRQCPQRTATARRIHLQLSRLHLQQLPQQLHLHHQARTWFLILIRAGGTRS